MSSGYAKIPRALVDDPRYRALSDAAARLYIALRAGPGAMSSGIYRTTIMAIAGEADRSPKQTRDLMSELQGSGLVEFDEGARVILIPDAVLDFPPNNPNGVESWARIVEALPPSPLRLRWVHLAMDSVRESWHGPIDRVMRRLRDEEVQGEPADPGEGPAEPRKARRRPDQRGAWEAEVDSAMEGWRLITGQNLRSESHRKFARGRIKEGFAVQDLLVVAKWAAEGPDASWWRGENDRQTVYLRPSTLWQPTKFEGYLLSANRWVADAETTDGATIGDRDDDARVAAMYDQLGDRLQGEDVEEQGEEQIPEFE